MAFASKCQECTCHDCGIKDRCPKACHTRFGTCSGAVPRATCAEKVARGVEDRYRFIGDIRDVERDELETEIVGRFVQDYPEWEPEEDFADTVRQWYFTDDKGERKATLSSFLWPGGQLSIGCTFFQ